MTEKISKKEKTWELIENSASKQKENELSEANAQLRILQQVTEAVHSSLELEKVFEQITDGFVNSMGYTTAFIATLDNEKKHLEIKTFSTKKRLLPKINKILGFTLKNFSFRADIELNDAISSAMNGRVVVVKTLAEIGYPLISKRKLMALQKLGGTKNCIIMPLRDEKEVVGGVVLTSSREEVLKEELGMIQSFAHAASQAIKNASLHQQTKQAEEALRKSEEKYKFLIDNSKEIILILSKTGKILFVNKNALKNFGYSDEELIGKSITHFLAKGSIRKALYALSKEFLGHPQPVMEIQVKTKSGKIRYLEVAEGSTPIYDKKKLTGVMVSASDITERKQAYEELRSSEERLKILYEYAPDAYYLSDLKGNFIDGNRAAEEITGYKKDELIGKNFLKQNLLSAGQIPKVSALLAKNAMGKPTGPDEIILNRKDGAQVLVEIRTFPVNVKGQALVLGIARDITERKLTEDALQIEKAHHEQLFESAQEAIVMCDNDGKVLKMNKKFMRLFGYTHDEATGRSIDQLVAPKESHKEAASITKFVSRGEKVSFETVRERKDGTLINVSVLASPINIGGTQVGVYAIYRDITERKQAEEELRKSEMMYRALFERANDAVFLLNFDGVHLAANKKAADMLGYSNEELIGKSFREIVVPHEYGKAREKFISLKNGKTFSPYERTFRKKDGTEFPVEINVALVRDAENKPLFIQSKPLFIQSIVRDITQRKRAEEQIKASLKEKEVLLQEIHHRVKNNMQIISSLLKLQSRHLTDVNALQTFMSSQNRVKSMALIHERLYQSKDFSNVDFNEYVRSLISHLFSSYGIDSGTIKSDIHIKDVFLNINTAIPCGLIVNELVSNSLKHAFPNGNKGEIKIAMNSLNGNEIELNVSDNGVGLPEDIDFRETDSLGLHLVTILAEDQLHGEIKLDRTEGTGFHMKLRKKE